MHAKLLRSSSPKHAWHGHQGSTSGEARAASHITRKWDQSDYVRHRSFHLRGNRSWTIQGIGDGLKRKAVPFLLMHALNTPDCGIVPAHVSILNNFTAASTHTTALVVFLRLYLTEIMHAYISGSEPTLAPLQCFALLPYLSVGRTPHPSRPLMKTNIPCAGALTLRTGLGGRGNPGRRLQDFHRFIWHACSFPWIFLVGARYS